jgi:hypothetical protein
MDTNEDVYSCLTRLTTQKENKVLSDRWIALNVLKAFPEVVFLE